MLFNESDNGKFIFKEIQRNMEGYSNFQDVLFKLRENKCYYFIRKSEIFGGNYK